MRIGILTGGGDCPGLNGVIRGVVTKGIKEYGYEFVGFRDGWKGPLEALTMPLDLAIVKPILARAEPSLVHLVPTHLRSITALSELSRTLPTKA